MSAAFLGTGWSFPLAARDGAVALVDGEENIRQSIWIILATAPGERLLRPDFGCGIHDLVFGVNGAATAGRAAEEVRRALVLWEPRVDQLAVSAAPNPDPAAESRLLIEIGYRVRATNTRHNLVYPFYLE